MATASRAEELSKLKDLLDQGVLTQDEFDEQKRQLLLAPQTAQQTQPQPIYQQPAPPVLINNTVSSHSSAKSKSSVWRIRRKHSLIFDIFMICITGGLWIIWMIFRPKYY